MINKSHLLRMTLGSLILVGATRAVADDWPQWRGPNRDDKVTGFTVPKEWPKTLTSKWTATVGAGDSTPALVGDKLYVFTRVGADEVTQCLDMATGKPVWQDKYAALAITGASARAHPGPRSSPAVADGKVYTFGVAGVLSCLDAATGKMLWRKESTKEGLPAAPQYYTAMSPMVVDGLCIAHMGGGQGAGASGAIIAYDATSGEQKWKWAGDAPAYASPILMTIEGTKLIVTQTEKSMVAITAADGKIAWQAPFAVSGMAYNAATPIIDGNTIIYGGQGRGTKAVTLTKAGDKFTGKEIWANATLGPQFNTPTMKDGMLYGLSDKANFFCMDAKTGQMVWTDTAKHTNYGSIVDAGSVLLAVSSDSQLTVIQPGGKTYTEMAKIKVSDKPIFAQPIFSGKNIIVKDADTVTVYTLE